MLDVDEVGDASVNPVSSMLTSHNRLENSSFLAAFDSCFTLHSLERRQEKLYFQ